MDFSGRIFRWWKVLLGAGVVLLLVLMVLALGFGREEEQRAKIGFITIGDIREAGWNASQYEGIKAATDKLGVQLLVRDKVRENSGECPAAIRELIEEGAGMIFLASYSYSLEAKELVEQYPQVAFATNSAEVHARNMTAYFVRMYQARFLSGALAGLRTKTNTIGYVAAMPNSEVRRGINAFALGVRRTNPAAKVLVIWTGAWQDEARERANAERLIKERGADVLTYHQDEDEVCQVAEEQGVDFIGYNAHLTGYSPHYLTSVICRWDLYYTDIVQRYLKGELNTVRNHWLGLERSAVSLSEFSPAVTEDTAGQIEALKRELTSGGLIFAGELYDNQGVLRCAPDEVISDDVLLERVDWLVQGVEVLE